jgi:hypothetical protein
MVDYTQKDDPTLVETFGPVNFLPRLMVCGYGRHGKDTACELLKPWKFVSSSMFVARVAVYPILKDRYGYESLEQCYDDRANHRSEWHELISEYNKNDLSRLAYNLYVKYDIYCGIRCEKEFAAVKAAGLFHLSIWIDASKRLPAEGKDSCTVTKGMCDIVIQNNTTLEHFEEKINSLKACLLGVNS